LGSAEKGTAPYEAIVVGAGAIGLAIAWRAAQRGMRTLVLDAGDPAGGATGVAAGMLAPVTEADFGEQALTELNLSGARVWRTFARELESAAGLQTGYRETGTLTVAVDRDDAERLRRLHGYQRSLGLNAEWLSARDCRRLEPGLAPGVGGGILAPHDHQVSPRALARALVAALGSAGGELRCGERVARVRAPEDRVAGVELESGECLEAAAVVIAAGAESGRLGGLPAWGARAVRPVKGQILRLRARPPVKLPATRVIRTPEVYAVPRADGRLVVGATMEDRGFDRSVTAGGVLELLRRVYEVLPGTAELELVAASAGLRAGTPDNGPLVGEGGPSGLYWATGHWRNGILLAPLTADAIVDMMAGGDPPQELSPFSPDRFTAGRRAEVLR
jgi:glycine oxidase